MEFQFFDYFNCLIILDGHIIIYPFNKINPTGRNLFYAEDCETKCHGVKGSSVLSKLRHYCPIKNTIIDFMHIWKFKY